MNTEGHKEGGMGVTGYVLLLIVVIAQHFYFRHKIFWIEQRLEIHKAQIGSCELRSDLKQWKEHS